MPAFVCGVCLAAILGLVAALATIGAHEVRAAGAQGHHAPQIARILPIVGFAAAVILMLYTLYVIASRAMGSGSFSDQSNRIVWHQKNTIRVGDSDDANSAPLAQQIAFATSAPAAVVTFRMTGASKAPGDRRPVLRDS